MDISKNSHSKNHLAPDPLVNESCIILPLELWAKCWTILLQYKMIQQKDISNTHLLPDFAFTLLPSLAGLAVLLEESSFRHCCRITWSQCPPSSELWSWQMSIRSLHDFTLEDKWNCWAKHRNHLISLIFCTHVQQHRLTRGCFCWRCHLEGDSSWWTDAEELCWV